MKVSLVTGGAGFIGTNLCRRLLEMGHRVVCVDNLSTGHFSNISDLLANKDFCFIDADIVTPISDGLLPVMITHIWHLACPASPPKYQAEPYKTLQTSLLGTMHMLELARLHAAKFLFTSTSEIYGDPLMHPQKESYWGNVNPVGPRSCYDEGKRCAETIIYEFRKQCKNTTDYKIVRLFNTYGPYMDLNDGRVITNYIKCVLNDEPITIYGDGTQTRSFCYVDDMIEAFIKVMNSDDMGPMNLGNPAEELNMIQLKERFDQVLGKTFPVAYHDLPVNDPCKRRPDITYAQNTIGWTPMISINEGIEKIIAYFQLIQNKTLC